MNLSTGYCNFDDKALENLQRKYMSYTAWIRGGKVSLLHDAFSVPKAGTYIPSGGTYIPCRRTYIPAFGTENIPTKTSKHISNNDVKKLADVWWRDSFLSDMSND